MAKSSQVKWPNNLPTNDRLAIASNRVEKLLDHWITILAIRESNAQMNSLQLRKQIPKSYAANCYNYLSYSQRRYELICFTAVWDKSSEDRDSIPTIFRLINDPKVRSAIVAKAASNYQQSTQHAAIDEYMVRRQREEIAKAKGQLMKLETLVRLISNHDTVKKIIAYRDETIAHSLSKSVSQVTPYQIPNAKGVWDLTEKCIVLLNSLVRNSGFDFKGSVEMHHRNAEYFWGGLTVKVKG